MLRENNIRLPIVYNKNSQVLSGISNGKGPRGYSRHFLHKKVVCQVFLACQNWSKLYHTQLHEGPIEIPFYNLSVGLVLKDLYFGILYSISRDFRDC